MWIGTAEQCRELDRRANEEYGVPPVVLMERAGLAVFDAIREMMPECGRVTVFCGKGKNGGDGLVVARHAVEAGYSIEVLMACLEDELCPDTAMQLAVARAQGVKAFFRNECLWERKAECVGCRDLIVDALLGTGASGALQGPILESIRAINRSGVPVISVDLPSGILADTGEDMGESVWAVRTVTFGLAKPFLFQGIGIEQSGYWSVADIGFPTALLNEHTDAMLLEKEWVVHLLPERLRASHKGENGHVLIVAGSTKMPGAACLAARAALRSGAGLVTVASVQSVVDSVSHQLPECILLPLPERDGKIAPEAADVLREQTHKYHAALFGPGLTHDESVKSFLRDIWSDWQIPCVIDADALNAVSQGVDLPPCECILTPHPGEMSRLLHCSIAEVQADRFRTVEEATRQFGKTILLKGPYSIVGEQEQALAVNCTGNNGMASGGMGDVLGGVLATLLAQDLSPYTAAASGMYWHGLAGDLCLQEFSSIGYRASEVADALPCARAKLLSHCNKKPCSY